MKKILNSSLVQKIIFVLSIVLIFFISVISYKHINKLSESTKRVNNTYNASLLLENLYMNLKELETAKRNYILERNDSLKNVIFIEKEKVSTSFNKLQQMSKNNPRQAHNLKNLSLYIQDTYRIVDETLNVSSEKYNDLATVKRYLMKGSPAMSQIKNIITEMIEIEKQSLRQRINIYDRLSQNSPLINIATLLITILLLTISLLTLLRKLRETKNTNTKLILANESAKMAEQIGNYGTWKYNVDKNEFQFSDNEYRLFGYEPQELDHKLEVYVAQNYPKVLERFRSLVNNLNVAEMLGPKEYKIKRKDGLARQLRDVSKMLLNLWGEKVLIGVTKDITDEYINQKKMKLKNIELEQKNKTLFLANETNREAEKTGKFGTTQWFVKENRFHFSDNNYRLLGLDPEGKAGFEELFGHIHPEDVPIAENKLQQMINQYYFEPYVVRIIRADNKETRYISISSKHISDYESEEYVLIISVDVTEVVNAQKTIIERNKELEISNKELQAFNFAASHDLQEPLRKIETFISRLEIKEFQNLSESGQQYFYRMKISAERMRTLIQDLLQFSRTNKSEKILEKTNLNTLLENVKLEIAESVEEKKAIIKSAELPTLKVIPFQIQQLILNLLGNSLKYSKPDVPPEIIIDYQKVSMEKIGEIKLSGKNMFHKFTFTDNGMGFEPEFNKRIFELFSRLHNRDEIPGTGIGLAICQKIVDNHKGYIFGDGKPDEGSVFTVYLPN